MCISWKNNNITQHHNPANHLSSSHNNEIKFQTLQWPEIIWLRISSTILFKHSNKSYGSTLGKELLLHNRLFWRMLLHSTCSEMVVNVNSKEFYTKRLLNDTVNCKVCMTLEKGCGRGKVMLHLS